MSNNATAQKQKTTTIQVDLEVRDFLHNNKRGREDYNDVLRRLITGRIDVYIEFILVDNELPQTHTVLFQLGENTDSFYFFDGRKPVRPGHYAVPVTLEEAQKLLKVPKPNMTINWKEAALFRLLLQEEFPRLKVLESKIGLDLTSSDFRPQLLNRLLNFLEGEPQIDLKTRVS